VRGSEWGWNWGDRTLVSGLTTDRFSQFDCLEWIFSDSLMKSSLIIFVSRGADDWRGWVMMRGNRGLVDQTALKFRPTERGGKRLRDACGGILTSSPGTKINLHQ
jgi:hypothetical protein